MGMLLGDKAVMEYNHQLLDRLLIMQVVGQAAIMVPQVLEMFPVVKVEVEQVALKILMALIILVVAVAEKILVPHQLLIVEMAAQA